MGNNFLTHYLFGFKWWFELVSPWTKSQSVTIQTNDTKQYLPLVLFITLYKVILTFESVDEILQCDHSNERYWAVVLSILLYEVVTLKSVNEMLKCVHSNECHRAVLSCGTVYNVVQANCNARHCEKYPVIITKKSSSAVATKMTLLTGCHSPMSPECSHPSSSIASFVFFSS